MPASSPQACVADFTAALIRRDMDAALDLLTDEALFFYSNGSTIAGKATFAGVMSANWKLVEDYQYTTRDTAWIAETADAAAVVYSFAWSGKVRGEPISGGGRGTRVLRRAADGWRIAHEHLSIGQGLSDPA